jgi:hypothetical protein
MTAAVATSRDADLAALAKVKLATAFFRGGELERLAGVLHRGERVVTLGDALFRSGRQERRGLVVLTDERLVCLESGGSPRIQLLEFRLPAITSLESGLPRGWGDAKRGALTIVAGGVQTHLTRIRPWECAEEIAEHILAGIAARARAEPSVVSVP